MLTALVTGGSRGAGRGVVEGLAEAGFRVFFTGRDKTQLDVTKHNAAALGGEVLPRTVDHTDDGQVAALFAEIAAANSLAVLVNNAWGGYERMSEGDRFTWPDPFWEQPAWRWDSMFTAGVRSAFVASQLAARAMLTQPRGLIVNVSSWAAQKHIDNTLYGMAKAATDKMTADMAEELDSREIDVISLYPGLVRTEKVMENADFLDLSNSESPRFIGRTIAALWKDPARCRRENGRVCIAAAIAREMGVTDVDGQSPEPLTTQDV
jgi:NAD(P)-dependent dehydrogenase (short-subunit alcohol dehydrogenase family)